MKKILHVVGARPQFVKLAPLYRAIDGVCIQAILHTGQHYDKDMSDSFFHDLDIPKPDYHIHAGSGSHSAQTARMLEGLEQNFATFSPDLIMIYGDTNSTLAAALVAAKMGIKIAHVEAGLRSFNRSMPEEINRIVADHLSDILLCPTKTAMHNCLLEGLSDKAHLVGDVMVDSIEYGLSKALMDNTYISQIFQRYPISHGNYYLLTLHRPYNVDDPNKLRHILDGLNRLDCPILFPVHPRTRKIIESYAVSWNNITMIKPLSYLDFIVFHHYAKAMITDSGGIQKEAYILHKPCITLRTETEWVETVEAGWNLLLDPLSADFPLLIKDFSPANNHPNLYGKNVCVAIKELIKQILE